MREIVMVVVLASVASPARAELPEPSQALGMALVNLCLDEPKTGYNLLEKAGTPNAQVLLSAIRKNSAEPLKGLDTNDPTLWGFLPYLRCVADRHHRVLDKAVEAVEKTDPNGELGELNSLCGARFSPGSRYLSIEGSTGIAVLEAATGKVVEIVRVKDDLVNGFIVFPENDDLALRAIGEYTAIPESWVISYGPFPPTTPLWSLKLQAGVRAAPSKDGTEVVLWVRSAFSSSGLYDYVEHVVLDLKTGEEKSRKRKSLAEHADWEREDEYFRSKASDTVLQDLYAQNTLKIISPDGRYSLEGYPTFGVLVLRNLEKGEDIRLLRFAPGVQ